MLPEAWRDIFLGQLERLIAESPAHLSEETPAEVAEEMLRMLLDDGATAVEETRGRFEEEDDSREPLLSLIQLYVGAIQAICEQDLCREQDGTIPSLFASAPLTSRWLLLEIVHSVRAVLLLSSRALDVQAVLALRQAWEFVAKSVVLASDEELGADFDRLSSARLTDQERAVLDRRLREQLSPYRTFRRVSCIERSLCADSTEPVTGRQAQKRLEDHYSDLSNLAHGGYLLAGVSEWSNFWRSDTLADGVSAPAEGDRPWHFLDLLRRVFYMLTYTVRVYPGVAFPGAQEGELRTFFDDWVLDESGLSEFENEYRLFLALHILGELGPEYDDLVFGLGDVPNSSEQPLP